MMAMKAGFQLSTRKVMKCEEEDSWSTWIQSSIRVYLGSPLSSSYPLCVCSCWKGCLDTRKW